ncbi:MAG: PEGA domain-containing protein [Patescibacteria group bacterium]
MTIRLRRIFFSLLGIFFVITATVLVLYAAGWRYNFTERTVEHVGGIIIDSNPRKATVLMDGLLTDNETPATIQNLPPGDVMISLQKDGFFSWNLPVTVISSHTVRIPTVELVQNDFQSEPIIRERFSDVALSADRGFFSAYRDRLLTVYSLTSNEEAYNTTVDQPIVGLSWSAYNPELLLVLENGFTYWLDPTSPDNALQPVNELFDENFWWMSWSVDENSILYATSENGLFRLNTFQRTKTLISEIDNVIGVSSEYIFTSNENSLSVYSLSGKLIDTLGIKLSPQIKLFSKYSSFIPLLDEADEVLFLFDTENNTMERMSDSMRGILWDDALEHNLYFNSNEIVDWNAKNSTREIIVRSSENLQQAYWIKNRYYVAYIQGNTAYLTEVRGPERNTYKLPYTNVSSVDFVDDTHLLLLSDGQPFLIQL